MPKHFVKILFAFLLLVGLGLYSSKQPEESGSIKYTGYVNEIQNAVAQDMLKELNLVYSGNSGRMHKKVETLGMQFTAFRRATLEEARVLQLTVMNRLVAAINDHAEIQSFLDEPPFSYKRVVVTISFTGPYGRYSEGNIAHMFNVSDLAGAEENRNKIFYFSHDPFKTDLIDHFEEHYEDALKLALASPIDPSVHQETKLEEAVDEVFPAFAREMRSTRGFECWSIGGKMSQTLEDVGVNFVVVQRATQDEARKHLQYTVERLLHAINSSEKLRPHLPEYPFPSSRLRIRIGFRTKKYSNYIDGSMESVTLEGNEVTYFQEVPAGSDLIPAQAPIFAKEPYSQ